VAQRASGSDSNLPSAQNPLAKNNSFISGALLKRFTWLKILAFYRGIFIHLVSTLAAGAGAEYK
jgi:hypothetical protein